MPPQKAKPAAASNSAGKKGKGATSVPPGTGAPAPKDAPAEAALTGVGKPDKAAYDLEQEKIKADIDVLQAKLSAVKDKISPLGKGGPGNERRNALRAELDSIRGQQSTNKLSRGRILDQLRALQDGIQKKVKDLQSARAKTSFKSVEEVDAHIKHLEKQVESGNMKLADEKRALQEISQVRRSRRNVENFQAEQDAIEENRRQADELRKQLDDPESKAVSERFDAIRAELDELKRDEDEIYANRSKLYDDRDSLKAQLDDLYTQKRESTQRYHTANQRHQAKIVEERAKRAEKYRAQRAEEEAQKKLEAAQRIREEAALPAYQAQIEDCQTLIDYFSGKPHASATTSANRDIFARSEVAGVPKLDIRKVDAAPEAGLVVRKKKGEVQEEAYFVAGNDKKSKKAEKQNGTPSNANAQSSTSLSVPFPLMSALLSLSIPPPASSTDVPRVIEDLKTKKAWFKANQTRVTAENVAKAEAEIARLSIKKAEGKAQPASQETPLNGDAAHTADPPSTAQVDEPPQGTTTTETLSGASKA